MRIESLIRIIDGVLQNTPSIHFIENFQTNPQKIERGFAYLDISNSYEDMKIAVANGAYAIITNNFYTILDEEIAWIQTKDIQLAILKLSRFFVQEKRLKILKLPKLHFDLLNALHVKIKFFKNSLYELFFQILNAKDETLFALKENEYSDIIMPSKSQIDKDLKPQKLFSKGLFLSSFVFEEKYYHEVKISSLFVPQLCQLLKCLETFKLEVHLENLNHFIHFYPQFVDKKLVKKEFGTSSCVLIFEPDEELFNQEMLYLQKFSLEHTLFLQNGTNEEKLAKLQNAHFRYALLHSSFEDFGELLKESSNKQLTLL
jgi:ferrochelatase